MRIVKSTFSRRNGNPVISEVIEYSRRGYSRNQIRQIAQKRSNEIGSKYPNGFKIQITLPYENYGEFRSGRMTDASDRVSLFSFIDYVIDDDRYNKRNRHHPFIIYIN